MIPCQMCTESLTQTETLLPNEMYVDDQHPNSNSISMFVISTYKQYWYIASVYISYHNMRKLGTQKFCYGICSRCI